MSNEIIKSAIKANESAYRASMYPNSSAVEGGKLESAPIVGFDPHQGDYDRCRIQCEFDGEKQWFDLRPTSEVQPTAVDLVTLVAQYPYGKIKQGNHKVYALAKS